MKNDIKNKVNLFKKNCLYTSYKYYAKHKLCLHERVKQKKFYNKNENVFLNN